METEKVIYRCAVVGCVVPRGICDSIICGGKPASEYEEFPTVFGDNTTKKKEKKMVDKVSLIRAEFAVHQKVNFWDGKKFKTAAVMGLNVNPIDKIVEYKLFYREKGSSGKSSRTTLTTTPYFIKESIHFNQAT